MVNYDDIFNSLNEIQKEAVGKKISTDYLDRLADIKIIRNAINKLLS